MVVTKARNASDGAGSIFSAVKADKGETLEGKSRIHVIKAMTNLVHILIHPMTEF